MNLIITGGLGPDKSYIEPLLAARTYTVAADSGLDLCLKWGIEPDLIIGDMDSLSDKKLLDQYRQHKVKVYPCDKDDSDTELALQQMQGRQGKVILLGGGEGRLDHSLALLRLFYRSDAPGRWITAREDIFPLSGCHIIQGWKGRRISLFSLGSKPMFCRSKGLQWELTGLPMDKGTFSLSNRMKENQAEIVIEEGFGLLMLEIRD